MAEKLALRTAPLAALLLAISVTAMPAGLGANDRRQVDDVRVDDATGQVKLLLVIDRPLEDGLTKPSAQRKLRGYRQWLDDPKFTTNFPQAKRDKAPLVLLVHLPPKNELGRSVLSQIEVYARELGFAPELQLAAVKDPPR
ncbi:hypothetical protein [Ideonella azotifigens]|uniref:Uncharacterized protein n=1 Tax=Ideonella azotifigens TaxID=513160 RepID=A0ABN1JTU7_9BURK|nr:hypothetical protein [Ideonella azotifigens]